MILREVATIIVAVALCVAVAGIFGYKAYKKEGYTDDNAVEEAVEALGEKAAEDILNLPAGSLEGAIDLTPSSQEHP